MSANETKRTFQLPHALAQSGRSYALNQCPLSGVKRTLIGPASMSANTQSGHLQCDFVVVPMAPIQPGGRGAKRSWVSRVHVVCDDQADTMVRRKRGQRRVSHHDTV